MTTAPIHALRNTGMPFRSLNPDDASVDVVDALARVGARCILIDCERTTVHIESVTILTRCAHGHGMAAVLRRESVRPETLDRGIDGIDASHAETVARPLIPGRNHR